nr:MAG TPA: hypothetical protein [Caudoviricetes sp.]
MPFESAPGRMIQDSSQAVSPIRACPRHEIEWYRARG